MILTFLAYKSACILCFGLSLYSNLARSLCPLPCTPQLRRTPAHNNPYHWLGWPSVSKHLTHKPMHLQKYLSHTWHRAVYSGSEDPMSLGAPPTHYRPYTRLPDGHPRARKARAFFKVTQGVLGTILAFQPTSFRTYT